MDDALVYRYLTEEAAADGLTGTEGTFCMCSYWFIECLARAGEVDRARLLFEKMHGYANHLGLYAEEMDPTGRYLGNFPRRSPTWGWPAPPCSWRARSTARTVESLSPHTRETR